MNMMPDQMSMSDDGQCGVGGAPQRTYYGKYRGRVADNQDPDGLGRLLLRVPSILGEDVTTDWALPCLPIGGQDGVGSFWIPEKEALVWVEFEQGLLSHPIWTGTFWDGSMAPPADATVKRTFKTPFGHIFEFDDTKGEEKIRLEHGGDGNASAEIDENGSITLTGGDGASATLDASGGEIVVSDANGNSMTMSSKGTVVKDSNGNKVEMAAAGITVSGSKVVLKSSLVNLGGDGGEPILKGQSFLQLFMTHTHPTGVGPSGPPVPQGEPTTLSTTVMTK